MLVTMESKTAAHHKLEAMIAKGRATAGTVIEHVMNNQPKDRLVRSRDLAFVSSPEATEITVSFPDGPRAEGTVSQRLHRNALNQLAQATDLPLKFVDSLQNTGAPWGRELLAHNFNTVFHNRMSKKQYLFRSLGTQVRGFLSDRYRRLDSRPIVEAFATAVQQKGALPYNGYLTDTKIAIQAIMPEVYEPSIQRRPRPTIHFMGR